MKCPIYIIMMVADVLAPIRCQAISNHHADSTATAGYHNSTNTVRERSSGQLLLVSLLFVGLLLTQSLPLKLRSQARGSCGAETGGFGHFRSAPLPQVCSHILRADAGGSVISWGQRWFGVRGFEADAENWVLDPFVVERILLPLRLRSGTPHVWTHVMICVEDNFPPAPTCVRSAFVWTYL